MIRIRPQTKQIIPIITNNHFNHPCIMTNNIKNVFSQIENKDKLIRIVSGYFKCYICKEWFNDVPKSKQKETITIMQNFRNLELNN